MMKKGKGYPEHGKSTGKSFGNPIKADVWGARNMRSVLNEWDKSSYEMPNPKKNTRKSTI
tara:strand:+ start:1016 stop:1195 length:180 start_codon:yes stop_codon:yes gene_type:complete